MQHIMWQIINNLDFENKVRADHRSPFIESAFSPEKKNLFCEILYFFSLDQCTPFKRFLSQLEHLEQTLTASDPLMPVVKTELAFHRRTRLQDAADIPVTERRLIKSHLPFGLLPPDLLERNKVCKCISKSLCQCHK